MKQRLWLLAILLVGCAEPRQPPEVVPLAVSPPDTCFSSLVTTETKAGGYSYHVQGGGAGGGTFHDLEFTDDPGHLEMLNITLEWTALSPLSQELRVDAWLYETLRFDQQPAIQGSSPLVWSLRIRDLELMEDPGLAMGPAEHGGPASASATIIDQPVTLTIEQVYCSGTVHP